MRAARYVLLALVACGCDLGSQEVDDGGAGGGTKEASNACSSVCHGASGEAAPPRDVSGRSDTSAIGVGAHRQHLDNGSLDGGPAWHKPLECATCHTVPQQIGDPGHLDPGQRDPAELTFTGMATGAAWDRATQTCTNSYCHGATLPNVMGAATGANAGGAITAPTWTIVDGSQSQCDSCHGFPPPAPHPPGDDCGLCHQTMNPGAGMVIAYPDLHINGRVDVDGGACDTCHGSNGRSSPPKDVTGNVATSARGVGAHAQHLTTTSSWHAPLDCTSCHQVPAASGDQGHMDTALPAELVWGPLAGNGTWNGTTCTNTYCHGGTATPLKGGAASSPLWTRVDGTQSQCGSCHGEPPPLPHPPGNDCATCHPTMTPGAGLVIAYPALHIDGKVDVKGEVCNSCHGTSTNDAPPLDTAGGTGTDLRSVGAHQNHLAASTWRKDIACADCHKVPGAIYAIGHIDSPLPAEVTFSTLGGSASWNGASCTNTYCHGATLGGGTSKNPLWTVVNGVQGQCGSCHGEPPPPPHPPGNDCGTCHNTMTPGGGLVITDPARHIDGNLDVNTDQACNSCHGGANNAPPKDLGGNTATNTRGVGAHQSHLATTNWFKPIACNDCHIVPATVTSLGHLDTLLPAELKLSARAGVNTAFNGARCSNNYCHGATMLGGTTTTPLWNAGNGIQEACTSCHGNPPPSPAHQTPNVANCGACHDTMLAGAITDPLRHIDGNVDVTGGAACNSCHGGGNDAPPRDMGNNTATGVRGVGAHQAHVAPTGTPWHKDVACAQCHRVPSALASAGHVDTALPAELVLTSALALGTSSFNGANCTSYCHGSTLAAGGTATSPSWTKVDGSQSACGACHGDPPPAPHPQGNVSDCRSCHLNANTGPGQPFAIPAQHIDGILQVTAVHPAGYAARDKHGYDFDKMGAPGCATSGCHGVALTGGTSGGTSCNSCHNNWQTTCTFCHGAGGASSAPPQGVLGQTAATDKHVGAHTEHVTATANHAAYACSACHTNPSSALTPKHIDGTGGIVQAEVVYGTLNPSGTYNTGTASCTTLYCHGNGISSTGSATWTSTTAMTCTSCHPTTLLLTGKHKKHIVNENMECAECHETVVNTARGIIGAALHVNGLNEVKMSAGGIYNVPATATWAPLTRSCSDLGNCHNTKKW